MEVPCSCVQEGEDTTIIKSRMILANVERMMKNGPRKIRRKWQEPPERSTKKRGGVVFLTIAIGNGVSFTVKKNCLSESDGK